MPSRRHAIFVFVAVLVAAALLVLAFYARAYQTTQADIAICKKIDRLDIALIAIVSGSKAPGPGDYGYDYFETHHLTEPDGAPGGRPPRAVIRQLRLAACDPANLASRGGLHK